MIKINLETMLIWALGRLSNLYYNRVKTIYEGNQVRVLQSFVFRPVAAYLISSRFI